MCDLNDVAGIIERIVAVSIMALTGREKENSTNDQVVVQRSRRS